jgi:hypothetical protein
MEENTDATSNAPITDAPTDEQLEDSIDQQVIADDTSEQPEEVVSDAPVAAEPPTRSERREQNYIDKLSEMISSSNQNAFRPKSEPSTTQETYQPLKYEEGDYDLAQLEADRKAYGDTQRNAGLRQAQSELSPLKQQLWAQQLEFDNERVQKSWGILDPQNEQEFDPDFASEMTQKYLNFIGYRTDPQTGDIQLDRPNIRWTDFVKAEKQNLDRYVERAQATSTKNIVKQASNTGIRPSGQARVSKGHNVDTSDPNWISKLSREEYEEWGRELADKEINKRLGIA